MKRNMIAEYRTENSFVTMEYVEAQASFVKYIEVQTDNNSDKFFIHSDYGKAYEQARYMYNQLVPEEEMLPFM